MEEGAASSVVKGERSEVKGRMLTVAGLFDKWSAGANVGYDTERFVFVVFMCCVLYRRTHCTRTPS